MNRRALTLSLSTLMALSLACGPVDDGECDGVAGRCHPQVGSSTSSSSSGGTQCPALACDMFRCEGQPAVDENGCPTCGCEPDPTPACGAIVDEESCRTATGCVVVYSGGGAPEAEPVRRPDDGFQCCTIDGDTVRCDGTPSTCMADADCGAGMVCSFDVPCTSSCWTDGDEVRCTGVCPGQCVVPSGDCRDVGCETGFSCQEMAYDCAVPPSEAGDPTTVDCGGGSVFQCVPTDCRAWGCGEGMECQELLVNCGGANPDGDDMPTNCMGGSVFECVVTDCRATGCEQGSACEEIVLPCLGAEDSDPSTCPVAFACVPDGCAAALCEAGTTCVACDDTMDCDIQCVPADCRATGCDAGFACQEMAYDCAVMPDESGDGDCGGPSTFACVPVDACAALTETECAYDADLCSPVYVSQCSRCAGDERCGGECETTYAGCQSVDG